jgi:hypothetical protein
VYTSSKSGSPELFSTQLDDNLVYGSFFPDSSEGLLYTIQEVNSAGRSSDTQILGKAVYPRGILCMISGNLCMTEGAYGKSEV